MTTNIDSLDLKPHYSEFNLDFRPKNLSKIIFNLEVPLNVRMKALNLYYLSYKEKIIEVTSKLQSIYIISEADLLKEFLVEIALHAEIPDEHKIQAGKCIYENDKKFGLSILNQIIRNHKDLVIECKLEIIFILLQNKSYKRNVEKYLIEFINDQKISAHFRYKTLLSMENMNKGEHFVLYTSLSFINYVKNSITYRMMGCQLLLREQFRKKLSDEQQKRIEQYLVTWATDSELCHELRADAADLILYVGSPDNQDIARDIIMLLGRDENNGRSIYSNRENVHIKEIEKSSNEILEFLYSYKHKNDSKITLDYIRSEIKKIISEKKEEEKKSKRKKSKRKKGRRKEQKNLRAPIDNLIYLDSDDIERIELALNRIQIDRGLYSKLLVSLTSVIIQLWRYIQEHEYKDEMTKRLIEELIDSSGKCSTGYVTRLVNVLSGFGDLSVRISWEDEIIAKIGVKLNEKIMKIEDENYQNDVLMELTLCSFDKRPNFLKFFRESISEISKNIEDEYKEHLSDTDIAICLKKAVLKYEGYFWT